MSRLVVGLGNVKVEIVVTMVQIVWIEDGIRVGLGILLVFTIF